MNAKLTRRIIVICLLLVSSNIVIRAEDTEQLRRIDELEQTVKSLTQRLTELEQLLKKNNILSQKMIENVPDQNLEDRSSSDHDHRLTEIETLLEERTKTDSMIVKWKNGLRFTSPDKQFQLKIGGRIMNDWAFFEADDKVDAAFGDTQDGTEFRRARFFIA